MVLALSVVRHADEQFANPVTTPIAGSRCTIGRGQECDIVLEDPTRHVSRRHATIVRQGESYFLTVESRINPVILNGQPVVAGQQAAVNLGDRLVIGEYEFNVVMAPAGEGATTSAPDPLAALGGKSGGPVDLDALFGSTPSRPGPAAPSPGPGIDALFGPASERAHDPLLDILGGGSSGRAAAPIPAEPHADDPLMRILGAEASSGAAPVRGSADDLLTGPGPVSSIDDLLGAGSGASADPLGLAPEVRRTRDGAFGGGTGGSLEIDHVHDIHLPMPMPDRGSPAAAPPARPVDREPPYERTPSRPAQPSPPSAEADPLAALFGPAPGAAEPQQDPLGLFGAADPKDSGAAEIPSAFSHREEMTGISPYLPAAEKRAPTAAAPRAAPSAARPAPAPRAPAIPAAASGSMQGAIRAFLEGAGMTDIEIAEADADAFIRECGGTVRAAVEGIMGMLLARAKVKEELRASDRTMVASKENNALKLIETVDEALRYVFDPATRTDAFLPPPKAVADACSDLQAHEIALVAGMRAALIGAIKLFQPQVIEKKMEKAGGKSLLANKKALLWDRFVAHYEELEKEAEDNFDRVFGAAFLRAYQEQVRRLRS